MDEILNLIESVSGGFPSYFFIDLPSIFRDNQYNHPYQIISRIVKYQSFVINIINLLGALISINVFLILISKLVPLTSETAEF